MSTPIGQGPINGPIQGHDIVVMTDGHPEVPVARRIYIDGHLIVATSDASLKFGPDMAVQLTVTLIARSVRFVSEEEFASEPKPLLVQVPVPTDPGQIISLLNGIKATLDETARPRGGKRYRRDMA